MAVELINCNKQVCVVKCDNESIKDRCIILPLNNCLVSYCNGNDSQVINLSNFVKAMCVKLIQYRQELNCLKHGVSCSVILTPIQIS